MSIQIAPLPPITLTAWAEQHLAELFKSRDDGSFERAFNATFTDKTTFTVNGQSMTLEQYRKRLHDTILEGREAGIAFSGTVEVPNDKSKPEEAGAVGLFMHVTLDSNFIVLGIPETQTVIASYNLIIDPQPSSSQVADSDFRRVHILNEVSVDRRAV